MGKPHASSDPVGVLAAEEIAARQPDAWAGGCGDAMASARARMARAGQWHPAQLLGRRWAIGCVALEVTQRCNLDCTLCYLSDMSEAVHDVPLPELFRRIDAIAATYGRGTGVQVTGGDPTLRPRADLVAIIARLRQLGLRPSLFTNGIKASRSLLAELSAVGLCDVAFHVDTTQQRPGYGSEVDLNAVRQAYINRTRGLPLTVFFNTTVHNGNFHEIPDVVRFFVAHSDTVRVASFQVQAETGRGVGRARSAVITRDSVAGQIAAGIAAPVQFVAGIGHQACNAYAVTLVAGGDVHCITGDASLTTEGLTATAGLPFDHAPLAQRFGRMLMWGVRHPRFLMRGAVCGLRMLWRMRRGLVAEHGRVHRLGFFIHDFMDACHLQGDRLDACAFMVATADGPVSMCLHNARRDSFITKPFRLAAGSKERIWDPLVGAGKPRRHVPAKGRLRQNAVRQERQR